jgi:hypothetical protein
MVGRHAKQAANLGYTRAAVEGTVTNPKAKANAPVPMVVTPRGDDQEAPSRMTQMPKHERLGGRTLEGGTLAARARSTYPSGAAGSAEFKKARARTHAKKNRAQKRAVGGSTFKDYQYEVRRSLEQYVRVAPDVTTPWERAQEDLWPLDGTATPLAPSIAGLAAYAEKRHEYLRDRMDETEAMAEIPDMDLQRAIWNSMYAAEEAAPAADAEDAAPGGSDLADADASATTAVPESPADLDMLLDNTPEDVAPCGSDLAEPGVECVLAPVITAYQLEHTEPGQERAPAPTTEARLEDIKTEAAAEEAAAKAARSQVDLDESDEDDNPFYELG